MAYVIKLSILQYQCMLVVIFEPQVLCFSMDVIMCPTPCKLRLTGSPSLLPMIFGSFLCVHEIRFVSSLVQQQELQMASILRAYCCNVGLPNWVQGVQESLTS